VAQTVEKEIVKDAAEKKAEVLNDFKSILEKAKIEMAEAEKGKLE